VAVKQGEFALPVNFSLSDNFLFVTKLAFKNAKFKTFSFFMQNIYHFGGWGRI